MASGKITGFEYASVIQIDFHSELVDTSISLIHHV